jgi:hypothetical protein
MRLAGIMRTARMHGSLTGGGGPPTSRSPTTQPANLRHVGAVRADRFAAFATGGSRLVGGEFMCFAAFMGGSTTLAGNFPLPLGAHGCKTPCFCACSFRGHN